MTMVSHACSMRFLRSLRCTAGSKASHDTSAGGFGRDPRSLRSPPDELACRSPTSSAKYTMVVKFPGPSRSAMKRPSRASRRIRAVPSDGFVLSSPSTARIICRSRCGENGWGGRQRDDNVR